MKNRLLFLAIFINFAYFQIANCQNKDLKISDLQTPVSPGFILLDQAPASVDNPTNPKALVLSLLNLKNGGAIEIAPYWLIKKLTDELTFDSYIKNKTPIAQTFSISVATLKTENMGTNVSAGFRITPFRSYNKSILRKADSLENELASLTNLQRINELRDQIVKEKQKPAFIMQIAGAVAGQSKTNSFSDLYTNRSGIWANAHWNKTDNFGLTILARYINNNALVLTSFSGSYADIGFSLNYDLDNFSLNAEGIFRKDNNVLNTNTKRLAIVSNYRLKDNLYLVGTFGRNFQKKDNIIALLGVNVGISKDSIKL